MNRGAGASSPSLARRDFTCARIVWCARVWAPHTWVDSQRWVTTRPGSRLSPSRMSHSVRPGGGPRRRPTVHPSIGVVHLEPGEAAPVGSFLGDRQSTLSRRSSAPAPHSTLKGLSMKLSAPASRASGLRRTCRLPDMMRIGCAGPLPEARDDRDTRACGSRPEVQQDHVGAAAGCQLELFFQARRGQHDRVTQAGEQVGLASVASSGRPRPREPAPTQGRYDRWCPGGRLHATFTPKGLYSPLPLVVAYRAMWLPWCTPWSSTTTWTWWSS